MLYRPVLHPEVKNIIEGCNASLFSRVTVITSTSPLILTALRKNIVACFMTPRTGIGNAKPQILFLKLKSIDFEKTQFIHIHKLDFFKDMHLKSSSLNYQKQQDT